MIGHYFTVACRTLIRYRMQSLISIGGLSVGLLCFGLCLYVVRYIGSVNDGFSNRNRLAEIILENEDGRSFSGTPAFMSTELAGYPLKGVEAYTMTTYGKWGNVGFEVSDGQWLPFRIWGFEIDSCFTDLFSCRFIYGSRNSAFLKPDAVILTESMAIRVFGNRNPVGKKMKIYFSDGNSGNVEEEHSYVYTVVGVIADLPRNNSLSYQRKVDVLFYGDSRGLLKDRKRQEQTTGCNTYALIYPGNRLEELNRQVREYQASIRLFGEEYEPVFVPLGQEYLYHSIGGKLAKILWIIGVLILLTALLNFFVFTVGQFYNRLHEFAIRKSIGGDRKHLFGLLFTEVTLMLLLSAFIVLCLVEWVYPEDEVRLGYMNFPLQREVIGWQILEYLAGLLFLGSWVCWYVVSRIDRLRIQSAIKGMYRQYVRQIVLILQLVICLLFLGSGAALLLHIDKIKNEIFSSLSSAEKGRIFAVSLEHPLLADYRSVLIQQFGTESRIADIVTTGSSVLKNTRRVFSYNSDRIEKTFLDPKVISADSGFVRFFNIPLIWGTIPDYENQLLADQTLVRLIDSTSIENKSIYSYDKKILFISGVMDKIVTSSWLKTSGIVVCLPEKPTFCYVKAVSGKEQEVKSYIEECVRRFLPSTFPFEVISFKEEIAREYSFERDLCSVITFFSIVCLAIALLGVYSAVTLDTDRRRKEVAIRKIHGAGFGTLIWMFGRSYLFMIVIASSVAFPLLWILGPLWQTHYAITVFYGWWFWIGIMLTVFLFIGVTIIFRVLRTVQQHPAEVIKQE